MRHIFNMLVISSGILLTHAAIAQDQQTPQYNLIQLQAEANRKVSNDEMTVVLYIEKSNKQPTTLATTINQTLNQAFAISKKYPLVKTSTGAQSTYPIYDNNNRNLKEWRTRAEIRLEGQDFKAVSQLMSELQSNFQTQSIEFSVSDAQKKKVENELIIEASKNFQQRAQAISQAWNKTSYQLVNLNFNSNNYSTPFIPRLAMAKSMNADAVPEQNISSGESQISINANGSIQLK